MGCRSVRSVKLLICLTSFTARFMHIFCTLQCAFSAFTLLMHYLRVLVQFLNFHGQPGARLDADQSVHEGRKQRLRTSLLLRIIDWFLFGTPSRHSAALKSVWVDQTLNQPRWRAFITAVNTEWTGFTIYVSLYTLVVDAPSLGDLNIMTSLTDFPPVFSMCSQQ